LFNILTLYNPYYQKDVIEQHIDVLLGCDSQVTAKVAFGKIRSKLRDYDHPFKEKLEEIYRSASTKEYVQLFLTDYASVYVAKVIEVTERDCTDIAPSYYKEKNLDVEKWFVISDIRQVVHNDFVRVRDGVLGNFTTPNFGNHHYAIYGNSYVYPLVVEMDEPVDYFEDEDDAFRYFTEIFKSPKRLEIKQALINYRFGADVFYAFHPNTQDALISAEIEYTENRDDPLYDFTSVIIKLSKSFEKELYLFLRKLFIYLIDKESELAQLAYTVQGLNFTLSDYRYKKPNLGTNKYLLKHKAVRNSIQEHIDSFSTKYFILSILPKAISVVQPVRNEAAHGESMGFDLCTHIRSQIVGIGESGVLCDLVGFGKVLDGI